MRWAISGLNTRETALVVWTGGFLLFALTKRDIRSSIGGLFKLLFTSLFIGGPILLAVAYATGTVLILRHVGYWERDMTKVAVLWFVGFALVALFNTKNLDASYYRHLVLHNLGLAVVVEFVANLHTFPLPVELVLVPMAFLLAGTQAYAEANPQFAAVRTVMAWSLSILGLLSLAYSISYLVNNFDEVATAERIKEFVLPLVLTTCFHPVPRRRPLLHGVADDVEHDPFRPTRQRPPVLLHPSGDCPHVRPAHRQGAAIRG